MGQDFNLQRRWPIALLGGAASVLLHGLLFVPVLLGAPAPEQAPKVPRESTLILVQTQIAAPAPEGPSDTWEVRLSAPAPLAAVVVEEIDFPREQLASDASAADPRLVALFGRYIGQIDARVQRAWIRPRTAVPSGLFECRVQISQDPTGRVLEIELVRCNGDIGWQTSLVHAIQGASPLPAPPDPSVFSPQLTLDFRTQSFSAGMRTDGFELAVRSR